MYDENDSIYVGSVEGIIASLEPKNQLIKEGRYTDPIDELLIKSVA